MEIRIGTSGWSYTDWEGVFYKPKESKFAKYSKIFNTVEIDSTFYSYPDEQVIKNLVKYSPEGFIFTAKIPSLITHNKKLNIAENVERDLDRFLELMNPLRKAGKLGPLLIQLPPKYSFEKYIEVFREFLKIIGEEFKYSVEFREASWLRDDVMELLSKYNVAYTIVDEPLLPPETYITSNFTYIRWHGRGANPWYYYHYKLDELEDWRPRIQQIGDRVEKIYGYFNNHFKGYAVHNALQVLKILGIITPYQMKILEEVEKSIRSIEMTQPSLFQLLPPEKLPEDINELLRILTDEARLKRAREIKGDAVKIIEMNDQHLSAKVKEYKVVIDLEKRVIIHDCADWSRVKNSLKLCKHISSIMLHLEKQYAKKILQDIIMNRGIWTFLEEIEH